MRQLLRLYPRVWQRRYRSEMELLLERTKPSAAVALDLLRGALDARMHPQCVPARWAIRRRPGWIRAAGLGVLAVAAGVFSGFLYWHLATWTSEMVAVRGWSFVDRASRYLDPVSLELAATWAVAAILLSPWRRLRPLAVLAGLLALRYSIDLLAARLMVPAFFARPLPSMAVPYSVAADPLPAVAVALAWTALSAPLLRRRLGLAAALLLASALELVLGRPDVAVGLAYAHAFASRSELFGLLGPSAVPPAAYLIEAALWAAALTWVMTGLRPGRGWDPGPGRWPAGVAVRPPWSPSSLLGERLLRRGWRRARRRAASAREEVMADYQETLRPRLSAGQ